ncbi:MAG TPA: allantoinase AllB [Thermoanaerobaculia bacterium]|nr:allantoinase AllB [Thermoanaerobaculia bacterium]
MPLPLVLRSRCVAFDGRVAPADVGIAAGRVVVVAEHGMLAGDALEDLGDLALLPGGVDPHVHVNEPGRAEWEGFTTATRAAAAGGITTLVDMPLNSSPVTTTVAALEAKRAAAAGRCHVDVAFHGGLVPANARDRLALESLLGSGVVGIKAFLCDSGLAEFPAVAHDDLAAAMPVIAAAGLPLLAHAERALAAASSPAAGPMPSCERYRRSRPPEMERLAVEELIALSRATGCRVHVVHLAAAEALPALRRARAEGLPVTVETCPHYLTFAAEEVADGDTRFKCAPPIRGAANREALWRALEDGVLDLVASDHSPCPPALKGLDGDGAGAGDFATAWGGIASLQVAVAATWTGLRARGHGLERLVALVAERPARLLGLARKGRIEAGADADLVAFDPEASFRVDPARLHHRHPQTPWAGRGLFGLARRTWLAGAPVQEEGEPLGAPRGRLLAREVAA